MERSLRVATEVVEYEYTAHGVTEKQGVKINVALTMPESATAEKRMSIGRRGTHVTSQDVWPGRRAVPLLPLEVIGRRPGLQ